LIVATVDLRVDLLPIRNQGRRQSCLPFATSTAHEHRISMKDYLSVEYLFYHAIARTAGQNPHVGTTFSAMRQALELDGQPPENEWPYSLDQVSPWSPPAITTEPLKAVMSKGQLEFDAVTEALNQGTPVILGLVITDAFFRPDNSGMVPDLPSDIERGGHAVLAVGYGVEPAGDLCMLIRNSWGSTWGIGGHGWLTRTYLDRQLFEAAVLN